ncbi:hypothetical protein DI396_12030 [Litorivita pollutaquae]|uniref:Uncharacterized protein n=1 Tax=Litorivita pollutaquae TaxID=2200892 RepID=A0A2V4NLR8_9RHOB|nr:hypothetical protein [Litorivita pollutaquae]PYC47267.1 hypothetical protein DI396_12030 [Litorivita pollutaquae]
MTKSHLANANPFEGPRHAFEVVGREVFHEAWRAEYIEDPKGAEHREVLLILRNALRSGDVSAHWHTLDFKHSGDLRPQDADQEFFRFILRDDLIFHHGMNEPVRCSIHIEQLRRWVRGKEIQPTSPTQLAKNQCLDWLVEIFSAPQRAIPPFEALKHDAKNRFPRLSDHAFKEARKRAIEITGRYDLAKAGRRKNPIGK